MSDEFATYPSLRGQVAFVSGGATGLGAEFVAQLAGQGVRVGFVDVQDDAGHALADALVRRGDPEPLYRHCDVRDVAAVQEAIAGTGERLGPVTVLVNNAANDERMPVETLSASRWDEFMEINASPATLAQQIMRRRHGVNAPVERGRERSDRRAKFTTD